MEIRQGVEVSFLDGIDAIRRGTVNGSPLVFYDGIDVKTMIPVYVREGDDCMYVNANNITAAESHSVKV